MAQGQDSFVDRLKPAALPGAELGWLSALREERLGRFREAGVPTRKVEAWKYTDLRALEKVELSPAPARRDVDPADVPALVAQPAARLVFVDGYLNVGLSSTDALPEGVTVRGLAETLAGDPGLLEGRMGALGEGGSPLAALNTALTADGAVVRIGKGVDVEQPIELVFVATGVEEVAYHPHHVIAAESNSSAMVVEHHVGLGDARYFANHAAELVVEDGARLRHVKLQREGAGAFHIASASAHVGRDARLDSFVLQTGAALARNELHVALAEEGAEVRLDGAYLGRGKQHIDNTTVIDHLRPHTASHEVYKGALDDSARAVFQGRIEVHPDAQRIEGHQLNRTLLLSDKAEIDTKPELQIYADDVKCSHGATAGEIDADQLFYMRTRGVPERTARALLVEAFLQDVVDGAPLGALREPIGDIIAEWMGRELDR